jgi:protoporphyrinogen oxidase
MKRIVILGAGPAGLTAGYAAVKRGLEPLILEQDRQVGGISRTVDYKGYLFDIGGHRFFTKSEEVKRIWHEILGPELLMRPRLSRIYYKNRFFFYPLRPMNALLNLGPWEAVRVLTSYAAAQLRPSGEIVSFEDWVTKRFGKRLFQIFFKTYTEKVWGISCRELRADWAAQRIKSLSLFKAVLDAFGLARKKSITTLIDEFEYPAKGPGQMWAKAQVLIERARGRVVLNTRVAGIRHEGNRAVAVITRTGQEQREIAGDHFISSLPLKDLILSLDPAAPDHVRRAAAGLRYRDFFTVGLIIEKEHTFPDNWIYIHSPEVRVGRIQNFKNWSPSMVPDPSHTSLGLEYFCFETDEIWSRPDAELVAMATRELGILGLAKPGQVLDGVVIRSKKTYPIYDAGYQEHIAAIRGYLATFSNLQTIGRNGLHRYNNQDHSMLTALRAVGNILGENHSVWDVNADDDYHEEG